MSTIDDDGNPFDPETCPCCQGIDHYGTKHLCDACMVAALSGVYPHGCEHVKHCPVHS